MSIQRQLHNDGDRVRLTYGDGSSVEGIWRGDVLVKDDGTVHEHARGQVRHDVVALAAPPQALTLADFLLARIAEDEERCRSLVAQWFDVGNACQSCGTDGAFILAECEAKRRIVELHRPAPLAEFYHGASTGSVSAWAPIAPRGDLEAASACETCGEFSEYGVPWPCPTLRLLALPYADHPDYDEAWRL